MDKIYEFEMTIVNVFYNLHLKEKLSMKLVNNL